LESPLPVLAGESNLDLLAILLHHVNALSPDRPRLEERDPLAFLPDLYRAGFAEAVRVALRVVGLLAGLDIQTASTSASNFHSPFSREKLT
jgi:hypothetical protein